MPRLGSSGPPWRCLSGKQSSKQSGNSIVMEIALKASAYIKAGQTNLSLTYASGDTTDFNASLHVGRGAFWVTLK